MTSRTTLAALPLAVLASASLAFSAAASPAQAQTSSQVGQQAAQAGQNAPIPLSAPWRCGCTAHPGQMSPFAFIPSDCGFSTNNSLPDYDPGVLYEIQVVFHVISSSSGAGVIPTSAITAQMSRLNQDFSGQALGQGTDTGIRFKLATVDPAGNPTNGITRTPNNTWFMDQGGYAAALSWDSARYLNIFTLDAGAGLIGYVPNLPQGGLVGTTDDRVVMTHSAINSPQFKMVLAHEVGHYLGLYHTFGTTGSCANTNCSAQGDLLCDTAPHSSPTGTCSSLSMSCGVAEPGNNYMNYLEIQCIYEFTPDQIRRMRCTLENWRTDLGTVPDVGSPYCQATANSAGLMGTMSATGSPVASANSLTLTASNLPPNQFGIVVTSMTQSFVPLGGGSSNGNICLGGQIGRLNRAGEIKSTGATGEFTLQVDLTDLPQGNGTVSVAMGETWNFQAWHRDGVGLGSNFTRGLEVQFQ